MPEDNTEIQNITRIEIQDEVKQSYLDYAMSVIVGRALPDVRDGLKPVHRRVLYAMHNLKNDYNKPHKKSARIVGDVIGKYHPHGDAAVYDTIVRMAQDFAMRYLLVDGQGNFGSIDGDMAAAMRYTEIRQTKIAHTFLDDLDKDTVDFVPNYDGSETMPEFLPACIPNLLVNGASGIAVGMATNIPTHNLSEVIDGCLALIDNPNITIAELMKHIPAPDFPTAAYINYSQEIARAYETGRGTVYMRAKHSVEEMRDERYRIVVEEIPYRVNKATLLENIADLVRAQKIDGISDLRDESNKEGIRVVIELKRGAIVDVIINNLFKHTALESSFPINMVAIVDGRPRLLNLKLILSEFVKHRRAVVTRRTLYLLRQARSRAHLLEGLAIAIANVDEVIAMIKSSPTVQEAKQRLLAHKWKATAIIDILDKSTGEDIRPLDLPQEYGLVATKEGESERLYCLSPQQAQAILELRLQRLTSMEREKLKDQYVELLKTIADLLDILGNPDRMKALICQELQDIKEEYGDERRSKIIDVRRDMSILDLIKPEDMLITLSHAGYIKSQYRETFRTQRRGGTGISAAGLKEDDYIEQLIAANSHDTILCFSNIGRLYWLRCYDIPTSSRLAKGKPMVNYLPLSEGERIVSMLPWSELRGKDKSDIGLKDGKDGKTEPSNKFIMLATSDGMVKRIDAQHFARARRSGITIMGMNGRELVAAIETDGSDEILLVSSEGRGLKSKESNFRPQGRAARGVRGLKIKSDARLIAMMPTKKHSHFVVISEAGSAKRTRLEDFPVKGRGGKGMMVMKITEDNRSIVGACPVNADDELMIIKENGQLMRTGVAGIPVQGRAARGVILTRLEEGGRIEGISPIYKSDLGDEAENEGEGVATGETIETTEATTSPITEPITEKLGDGPEHEEE